VVDIGHLLHEVVQGYFLAVARDAAAVELRPQGLDLLRSWGAGAARRAPTGFQPLAG
jgi:hypothetical protein